MKFCAKQRSVDVGVDVGTLKPDAYPSMPTNILMTITEKNGHSYSMPLSMFVDSFDAEDGDAETWLAGLVERKATLEKPEAPEEMFGDIDGMDVLPLEGGGTRMKIRKKKPQ